MNGNVSNTASLRRGDRVEVRTRFSGDFTRGFEVFTVTATGYRLRRISDGVVLPVAFDSDDVRPDDSDDERTAFAERTDGALIVRLPRSLDHRTVERLGSPLLAAIDSIRGDVILDLDSVELVDRFGIRFLMTLQRRAWHCDRQVRLRGGNRHLRAFLELVSTEPMVWPAASDHAQGHTESVGSSS